MNKKSTPVKRDHTIIWWVGWIALTIASFFLCHYFWTWFIAKYIGSMQKEGVPIMWVAVVFGSWLILLIPLIIIMYNKVDRAYDESRTKQELDKKLKIFSALGINVLKVPSTNRILPKVVCSKLKKLPKTLNNGQLVALIFKDGKKVSNFFILACEEIVGVYDQAWNFNAQDVVDAELLDPGVEMPVDQKKWLRLED